MTALPSIGKPTTRALALKSVTTLEPVAKWSEKDLNALHGVGPKAIRILREALADKSMSFKPD